MKIFGWYCSSQTPPAGDRRDFDHWVQVQLLVSQLDLWTNQFWWCFTTWTLKSLCCCGSLLDGVLQLSTPHSWCSLILPWRLKWFNRNSIGRIPICIKDILQLQNDGGVVRSKAHSSSGVEVIPDKVAGANVCPHITDSVLAMVHPGEVRVTVPRRSALSQCRSCLIIPRNHVVFDLDLATAVVVFGGCAEDVWV